jgi:hypothetical protein
MADNGRPNIVFIMADDAELENWFASVEKDRQESRLYQI